MMFIAILFCTLMSCNELFASSLGVVGETFPVAEMSLLTLIESRLQQLDETGEMQEIEKKWVAEASSNINRPKALGLDKAQIDHTYTYKPEIILQNDIKDAKGNILFTRGTSVNALERLPSYNPHWLFINGDDESQVAWAEQIINQIPDAKVILTGGALDLVTRQLNKDIYFDQEARITKKLNIAHVPAIVSRKGNELLIHEVVIGEGGHAHAD